MRKVLIRGLCVLIDVAWFLFAVLLCGQCIGHYRRENQQPRLHHVRIAGGDIIYRDYWTTDAPLPLVRDKPWYECLIFTNENCH